MKIKTRTRLIVATLFLPGIFLISSVLLDLSDFDTTWSGAVVPLLMATIQMLIVAWVVHFQLKGENLFAVTVFPGLSLGILVGFLTRLVGTFTGELDRYLSLILLSLILAAVIYVLNANMNILNLATKKPIPLAQAAKAAHYISTMIFSYFGFVLIVSSNLPFLTKPLLASLMVFAYSYIALWTISQEYRSRLISSMSISILLGFAYLVLSLWPLSSFYMALFLVLMFYMSLGVALEIREMISNLVWYEYAAIFLVMILVLLSTASWGVNGTIL
ncbi:MAG: hypothetical protein ACOCXP_01990 [Candidatus Dojkabacteria bacterium]